MGVTTKLRQWVLVVAATATVVSALSAQDLVNTGQINNTGMIRIKRLGAGLPSTVNGTVEFYGGTQVIQATQYKHLRLTGSGTKTTLGGNFSVTGNLFIDTPVTMDVQAGTLLTLGDTLFEKGYFLGSIRKTVDLSGPRTSSDFGNIGSTISWSGTPPGTTAITRTSGKAITSSGRQSIKRYYDILPANSRGLNAAMVFRYNDKELNGNKASALELWRLNVSDSTWRRQKGIVDTVKRTITKSGILSLGRWTASDALLGRPEYEWVPTQFASLSGNGQTGPDNTALQPFVVNVRDAFDNVLPNTRIVFSIVSSPPGSVGQRLSVDTAFTDTLGRASTILTLGNGAGVYSVQAVLGSLPSILFTARAAIVFGDANNDFSMDIADLTSLISHITGKKLLTGDSFKKADFNKDGVINREDIDSVKEKILTGTTIIDSIGTSPPGFSKATMRTKGADEKIESQGLVTLKGEFEITPHGLRFNLLNDIPITGFQAYVRFKTPVNVTGPDVVYPRGKVMETSVRVDQKVLRLVGYNLKNTPIPADSGSLFRLPIKLSSRADIESVSVALSNEQNQALKPPATTSVEPPGKYPTSFALLQNYPNPFNGSTNIQFDVPDLEGKFAIAYVFVYNILGQRVKTLVAGELDARRHTVQWDGTSDLGERVASGVYVYQLIARNFTSSKKMVYVK